MKLLYVKGSPRAASSQSAKVAATFLESYKTKHPDAVIDEIDLWQANLPEFDGDRAAAKMSFFGEGTLEGTRKNAWDEIVQIADRFTSADDYLFTVPMWNGGIPYKLKQYIDILHQPGLLFGFDPATGYFGLLKNKRATAIFTSGVYHPGLPAAFGVDHHSSYLKSWLTQAGVVDLAEVRYQPTLVTADVAANLVAANAQARLAATR
jgi:FMN-dependent NADH-azoreductase